MSDHATDCGLSSADTCAVCRKAREEWQADILRSDFVQAALRERFEYGFEVGFQAGAK
jgi:hypothetical protein